MLANSSEKVPPTSMKTFGTLLAFLFIWSPSGKSEKGSLVSTCEAEVAARYLVQEESFFQDNFFVRLNASAPRTSEAYLFLHGFPAEPPLDPKLREGWPSIPEKGIDIAQALHLATGNDAYVMHYAGLGRSKGVFSFTHSIEEAIAFAEHLRASGYKRVHVVGHSWGGLVAIQVYKRLADTTAKLVLIAPYTNIPDRRVLTPLLNSFAQVYPNRFEEKGVTADDLINQMLEVKRTAPPSRTIAESFFSPVQLTVIQGRADEEVSPESTKAFCSIASARSKYVELEGDHSFSENRSVLLENVQKAVH